jgi:hypothetical protein
MTSARPTRKPSSRPTPTSQPSRAPEASGPGEHQRMIYAPHPPQGRPHAGSPPRTGRHLRSMEDQNRPASLCAAAHSARPECRTAACAPGRKWPLRVVAKLPQRGGTSCPNTSRFVALCEACVFAPRSTCAPGGLDAVIAIQAPLDVSKGWRRRADVRASGPPSCAGSRSDVVALRAGA